MTVRMGVLVEDSGHAGNGKFETHRTKVYLDDIKKEVTAYTKYGINETSMLVEIISALIGREIGLPIPEPLLVADHQNSRILFGCIEIQHPDLSRVLDIHNNQIINTTRNNDIYKKLSAWEYLNLGCVFDEWIANDDRNIGNLLFDGNDKFHLIDHNRAMRLPFSENQPVSDNFLMKVNVFFNADNEVDAQRVKSAIKLITETISINLPSEIAADFLARNPEFSSTTIQSMVHFLQTRLHYLFTISERKIPTRQQAIL